MYYLCTWGFRQAFDNADDAALKALQYVGGPYGAIKFDADGTGLVRHRRLMEIADAMNRAVTKRYSK